MPQFCIRDITAWMIAVALLCATPRLWLFLLAWGAVAYLPLAIVATADLALCAAVGPRPGPPLRTSEVFAAPVRLLIPGRGVGGITPRRLTCRGVAVTLVLVGLRALWKYAGLDLAMIASELFRKRIWSRAWRDFAETLGSFSNWSYLAICEAWSVSRWWLLFGTLTLLVVPFSDRDRPWRSGLGRLMVLSPWLVILETGFLFGVWFARGEVSVVPEPGTLFASFFCGWQSWLRPDSLRFWLLRGGVPTFATGIAFFYVVGGWRLPAAVTGAVAIIPPALGLSMLWTALYIHWF